MPPVFHQIVTHLRRIVHPHTDVMTPNLTIIHAFRTNHVEGRIVFIEAYRKKNVQENQRASAPQEREAAQVELPGRASIRCSHVLS
jgi:hypothetical protein